ncbi:MAG: LacI family DNA-binding transcriptional regulator [Thermomicrobiales bacterium]
MVDIAQRAGVSLSTVSYALSGKRRISEPTRLRVLAAMAELDFQPHAVGRALASRRSHTIALLYPSSPQGLAEMPLEFVLSAVEAASKHGYSFRLSTTPDEDQEILRMIRQGFVDGLILMEIKLHDPRVELLRASNYPFTLIGHCAENEGVHYVDLDFEHAQQAAVDHLADLGHRRIVLVGREQALHDEGYGPSVRSAASFTRACQARGVTGEIIFCESIPRSGYDVIHARIATEPAPSAIIVLNSEAIGGIMRAIHDHGLCVPDELSIVAVTSRRIAELITPPLTTMDFPAADMGRMGVELLIRQLEGGGREEPAQSLLRAQLSVRRSSGPNRASGRVALAATR